MRDPNRIPAMIEIVSRVWTQNPDLRLGQILGNCDISYYTEDDVSLERLEKYWRSRITCLHPGVYRGEHCNECGNHA